MKLTKKVVYNTCIIAFLTGIFIFIITYSPKPKVEIEKTDNLITSLDEQITTFQQSVEEHKVNTIYRTTVIREAVREEVANLDPDALAIMALEEIDIYQKALEKR